MLKNVQNEAARYDLQIHLLAPLKLSCQLESSSLRKLYLSLISAGAELPRKSCEMTLQLKILNVLRILSGCVYFQKDLDK